MNNSHDNNKKPFNGKPIIGKTIAGLVYTGLSLSDLPQCGSSAGDACDYSNNVCSVADCSDPVCSVADCSVADWDKTAKELYDIRLALQRYSSREKELKEKLIKLSNNESMHNDNYEFKKSFVAGLIDYIKIINDYEIDVEKYRKPENARWKLTKL